MKKTLATLAISLLMTGMAGAQPVLKSEALIHSDIVTVGDLVDNAGNFAEQSLFLSPEPGTRGSVPVALVLEALQKVGVEDIDVNSVDNIKVERAGRIIDREDIRLRLIESASVETGDDLDSIEIELYEDFKPFVIAAEITKPVEVQTFQMDADSGTFMAVLQIAGMDKPLTLQGQAYISMTIPVLARDVDRDEPIRATDIEQKTVYKASLVGRDIIRSQADLIGKAAKRSLRAGEAIYPRDVTPVKLVQRNAMVTIQYKKGPLILTMQGKAMEDGAEGEMINLQNVQSRRTIQAMVKDVNLAEISHPAQLAALQ